MDKKTFFLEIPALDRVTIEWLLAETGHKEEEVVAGVDGIGGEGGAGEEENVVSGREMATEEGGGEDEPVAITSPVGGRRG